MPQFLITPYPEHPIVETPLHLITEQIIDSEYKLSGVVKYSHTQDDLGIIERYIEEKKMPFDVI